MFCQTDVWLVCSNSQSYVKYLFFIVINTFDWGELSKWNKIKNKLKEEELIQINIKKEHEGSFCTEIVVHINQIRWILTCTFTMSMT